MRLGFNGLYKIALIYLHIDIKKGRNLVAFFSKSCKIAKIIRYDNKGSILLIVRHLDWKRFK